MTILKKVTYSDKDKLCGIQNQNRNQEYTIIFFKNGTFKLYINDKEIALNKIHYNRILKKIFEI